MSTNGLDRLKMNKFIEDKIIIIKNGDLVREIDLREDSKSFYMSSTGRKDRRGEPVRWIILDKRNKISTG